MNKVRRQSPNSQTDLPNSHTSISMACISSSSSTGIAMVLFSSALAPSHLHAAHCEPLGSWSPGVTSPLVFLVLAPLSGADLTVRPHVAGRLQHEDPTVCGMIGVPRLTLYGRTAPVADREPFPLKAQAQGPSQPHFIAVVAMCSQR